MKKVLLSREKIVVWESASNLALHVLLALWERTKVRVSCVAQPTVPPVRWSWLLVPRFPASFRLMHFGARMLVRTKHSPLRVGEDQGEGKLGSEGSSLIPV
jgi:hypothetical protein